MNLERELEIATSAVHEAGKGILSRYESGDLGIEFKEDGSPATVADKEAEDTIKAIILDSFSTHSFVGEESSPIQGTSNFIWYCDPIDGTWGVINGEKTSSTSLALAHENKTVLAVVYNPFRDELYLAAEGISPTVNGQQMPRVNQKNPAEAVYTFQISPRRKSDIVKLYDLWEQKTMAKLICPGGSIAYNLAQVAEGAHSVYVAASTAPSEPWDIAGGVYLVESVGGVVSQMDQGKVLVAATNPTIHKKTLSMLEKVEFGR